MTYPVKRSLALLREHGLAALAGAGARQVRLGVVSLLAPAVLRRRSRAIGTIDEALDFAVSFSFGGVTISPLQQRAEIRALLELLEQERPRVLVEIGTALGGTLFLFSRVAAEDGMLVSIDLRGGRFGGGYPAIRKPLYRSFARARQRVELIRADSHAAETLEQTKRLLAGRPVDFLFIDGDHSYEGVRRDFELYGPLVRPGGLVAFHDIVPGGPEVEVPRYWAELEQTHETRRLLKHVGQSGKGIGVLRVA